MEKNFLCQALTEKDISFLVQVSAPAAKKKEGLKEYARNDRDFQKILIEDEKVLEAIRDKSQKIMEISAALYFEILLRGAVREIEKRQHTIEVTTAYQIRVFDAKETLEFLKKEYVISYLVYLLSSFVSDAKLPTKEMSLKALAELAKSGAMSRERKCHVCQRIADNYLFLLGIFPLYIINNYVLSRFKRGLPVNPEAETLENYEKFGQEYYELASKTASPELSYVLKLFSQNFRFARKPLTFVSTKYLAFS